MAIQSGQQALASDFVSVSSGAGDAAKAPKLNESGKLSPTFLPFGGDGSDGELNIISGVTTIDLGGQAFVVKNYTSILITGSGKLAFTNPNAYGTTIILRSQGNVTLTSSQAPMIDAGGIGALGGNGVSAGSSYVGGNVGNAGIGLDIFRTNGGGKGSSGNSDNGPGGPIPTAITPSALQFNQSPLSQKYPHSFVGAGAGSGGAYQGSSGAGGRGGGCVIIECGGAWNFTTANGISVAGRTGNNGSGTVAGGGGGGGGGFFLALYKSVLANTGTVTVAGGLGGSGNASGQAFGGSGGGSATNAGVSATSGSVGGAGGAGLSFIGKYVE